MKINTLIRKLRKFYDRYGNCYTNVKGFEHFEYGRLIKDTNHRDKNGIRIRV